MYAIIVYDVRADRTHKPRKLLRRYLTHAQNSVFEGEISAGDLKTLRAKLQSMLHADESAIVYAADAEQYLDRSVVGDDPREDHKFI